MSKAIKLLKEAIGHSEMIRCNSDKPQLVRELAIKLTGGYDYKLEGLLREILAKLEKKPKATKESPVCKHCESWEGECTSSIPCDMDFSAFRVKKPEPREFTKEWRYKASNVAVLAHVKEGSPIAADKEVGKSWRLLAKGMLEACDLLDEANTEIERLKEAILYCVDITGAEDNKYVMACRIMDLAGKIKKEQARTERKG